MPKPGDARCRAGRSCGVISGPTQPEIAATTYSAIVTRLMPSTRGHADHDEQHRQIEGEGRELAALRRSRRSSRRAWRASGSDPCAGRRGRRVGCGLGTTTSWSGSMSSRSSYISHRDLLGLAEPALADQPDRRLRQVVAHDQDDQRRHRAEAERHAPDQLVVHVDDEEDRDHRRASAPRRRRT